jgi:hypothetical protein
MRPSRGSRLRWENNIDIVLKMIRFEGADLIKLSEEWGGGVSGRAVFVLVWTL